MKIGIVGTGMVGAAIGGKLVELGHEVKMGSRTANNDKAVAWAQGQGQGQGQSEGGGGRASHGTFADAAAFGEMVFNCTSGMASVTALTAAGADNLAGKVLVDLSNPLDFSHGMPPTLAVCNTDSLGEQIQRAFPQAKVVKTLNTMNCSLMVNPALLPGDHDVFVSGNDEAAKAKVTEILRSWFGWKQVIDLGDIASARGTEMMLPIWLRLMGTLKTPMFNFHILR